MWWFSLSQIWFVLETQTSRWKLLIVFPKKLNTFWWKQSNFVKIQSLRSWLNSNNWFFSEWRKFSKVQKTWQFVYSVKTVNKRNHSDLYNLQQIQNQSSNYLIIFIYSLSVITLRYWTLLSLSPSEGPSFAYFVIQKKHVSLLFMHLYSLLSCQKIAEEIQTILAFLQFSSILLIGSLEKD